MITFIPKPEAVADLEQHTGSAVIRAHAGTGKTYTIERLVVDLLIRPDPHLGRPLELSEIVVVTFTDKATNELIERVRALIEDFINPEREEKNPLDLTKPHWQIDDVTRDHLRRNLQAFDLAPISTIHGFCHRILKESAFLRQRPFSLEIDSGNEIARRAFRTALRHTYAVVSECRNVLTIWMENATIDSLQSLLMRMHQKGVSVDNTDFSARWNPASIEHEFAWLDQITQKFPPPDHWEDLSKFIDNHLGEPLASADPNAALAKKRTDTVGKLLNHFATVLQLPLSEPVKVAVENLVTAFPVDAKMKHRFQPDIVLLPEMHTGLAALNAVAHAMWLITRSARTSCEKNICRHIANLSEKAQPPWPSEEWYPHALFTEELSRALAFALGGWPTLKEIAIQTFLPAFSDAIESIKRTENVVDFDDILRQVAHLVATPSASDLVTVLRKRFRVAIIDEFQDTDDIQWSIFHRLFYASDAHRCYLVGDAKQSIYAFRGANLQTYLDATESVLSQGGISLNLQHNYRSSGPIIDGYNRILSHGFFSGRNDYSNPVICGLPDESALIQAVEIFKVDHNHLELGSYPSRTKAREYLAHAMAKKIHLLLAGNSEFKDPIAANNIYILTRTGTESLEVARILRRYGIPHALFKQAGLFSTPEALDILDILLAIEEPTRLDRLSSAWLTHFFELTINDVASLHEAPDTHPLKAYFIEWNQMALTGRVSEMLDNVLHRTGILRREILFSPSERILTNILHIFEIIGHWFVEDRPTFSDLVVRLVRSIDTGGESDDEGREDMQRLETDRAAVQIMTMHSSKGLEADVVFLYGGWSDSPVRSVEVINYQDSPDKPMRVYDSQRPDPVLQKHFASLQREENERLLYVAITRAKKKLFLPLVVSEKAIHPQSFYSSLNNRLRSLECNCPPQFIVTLVDPLKSRRNGDDEISWPSVTLPPPPEAKNIERENQLRHDHRAPQITSYSKLKLEIASRGRTQAPARPTPVPEDTLPGGAAFGNSVHHILERISLSSIISQPDPTAWAENPENQSLIADGLTSQGFAISHAPATAQLIHRACTVPLAPPKVQGFAQVTRERRELEFLFPWEGRGYVRGFIDAIFTCDELVYFLDWKSDRLTDSSPESLATHVADHYELQARLYAVAVTRMLNIRCREEYERLFGGGFYVFVRTASVHACRPAWEDLEAMEQALQTGGDLP